LRGNVFAFGHGLFDLEGFDVALDGVEDLADEFGRHAGHGNDRIGR